MYENPLNGNPPPASPLNAAAPQGAPSPNFYAPPVEDYDAAPVFEDEGNYGLGMIVGIVFSLLGLIIVLVAGKSATKRGAMHGFLIRLGLSFVMLAVTGVFF